MKDTWETNIRRKDTLSLQNIRWNHVVVAPHEDCVRAPLTKADLTIREDEAAAAAEANGDAEGVGVFDPVPNASRKNKQNEQLRWSPMATTMWDPSKQNRTRVLVAELKRMREDDLTNKALIFTQFTQTIDWLQRRLPEEGFGFRTISGSMAQNRDKSIQAFQKDPPRLSILSVRSEPLAST